MLGSAGWIGLEPAMFTRSETASGRPAGGRRVLQRDGALGTCAESSRARAGYPQPKTRSQRFPGPESKNSDERETPDSTCTQQTLRTPAKLFTSSAAELLSLSLSLYLSLSVFTPRSAPPLPQHSGKGDPPTSGSAY